MISARDPGVANWLDTRGYGSGSVIMRWQGVTVAKDNSSPAELIVDSKVVSLNELKVTLADGVPMMAGGRCQELEWRKVAYERRLR